MGCLPRAGGVEDQEPELIAQIMLSRNARYAIKLMNGSSEEKQRLAENPDLAVILKWMVDAQNGVGE